MKTTATVEKVYRRRFWQKLTDNPVALKELRSRMRGRRAFLMLTGYLIGISSFVWLIYLSYVDSNSVYGPSPDEIGKIIFSTVISIQIFGVLFISPAFTTSTVTGEKERQTYELLRTTTLPASQIVLGKLISALGFVLLLVMTAIPLQSIAFFIGGVALVELVVAQLVVITGAIVYAMIGLYFSAAMRTTMAASAATYAMVFFLTIGLPIMLWFGFIFVELFYYGVPPYYLMAFLIYGGIFLAATNLPATIILSEIFLLEYSAVWGFKESLSGQDIWIASPWPFFILINLSLAFLLFRGAVGRIQRVPTK